MDGRPDNRRLFAMKLSVNRGSCHFSIAQACFILAFLFGIIIASGSVPWSTVSVDPASSLNLEDDEAQFYLFGIQQCINTVADGSVCQYESYSQRYSNLIAQDPDSDPDIRRHIVFVSGCMHVGRGVLALDILGLISIFVLLGFSMFKFYRYPALRAVVLILPAVFFYHCALLWPTVCDNVLIDIQSSALSSSLASSYALSVCCFLFSVIGIVLHLIIEKFESPATSTGRI